MIVQEFKEEHYKIAVKWWQAHKWGALPIQCLPKTGALFMMVTHLLSVVFISDRFKLLYS